MVQFHFSVSDHGGNRALWSPSQELSNDILHVWLSENFIISTCLRFEVWDGLISPVYVRSW